MAICYNIIYSTLTSAFSVHGGTLDDDIGMVLHDCGYYVNTDSTINPLLVLSANSVYGVTSANTDFDTMVTSAISETSGTPNISATFNEEVLKMKISLVIKAISPVIKSDYKPISKVKPTSVVTR